MSYSQMFTRLYWRKFLSPDGGWSSLRVVLKTIVIYKALDFFIFDHIRYPVFSANTPAFLEKRIPRHLLTPPLIIPYPDDVEETEKYHALNEKIREEAIQRRTRLQNLYFDDPSRETSTIIEERMYDDENDKGFNELRLIASNTLVGKTSGETQKQARKLRPVSRRDDILKQLNAKIKPA